MTPNPSREQQGFPPRVAMTYKHGGRPQVATAPRMDAENHVYLSEAEHTALLLEKEKEIERLKALLGGDNGGKA